MSPKIIGALCCLLAGASLLCVFLYAVGGFDLLRITAFTMATVIPGAALLVAGIFLILGIGDGK